MSRTNSTTEAEVSAADITAAMKLCTMWPNPANSKREIVKRTLEFAQSRQPSPAQVEPDMRAICEALGFDPTNHHNAAKCPYCRPATPTGAAEGAEPTADAERCKGCAMPEKCVAMGDCLREVL